MRSVVVITLLAVVACSQPPPGDSRGETTGPTSGSLVASCTPQPDNVLRVDCEAQLDSARALTITWTDGQRTHRRQLPAAQNHTVTLTGLTAETLYDWRVEDSRQAIGGSFESGALPQDVPTIEVTGQASVPFVLLASGHRVIIAATDDGRVVWYDGSEPDGFAPQRGVVSGYDWTGDGVVWQMTSQLHHVGLDGTRHLFLQRGVDYERALHHDVFWADGRIWTLNAGVHQTPVGDMVYDGLYAIEGGEVVGEWDLYDHDDQPFEPSTTPSPMWADLFPGAADRAHGNAVFETADGTVLVSLRKWNSVWALAGLDQPDFGEVRWRLRGDGGASDFALSADPGLTDFVDIDGQHNPRLVGNRLTLFDNRVVKARTVALELDHQAGSAHMVEIHEMGARCLVQGSSYELSNGNTLATCGDDAEFLEFEAGSAPDAYPVWRAASAAPEFGLVARAIPIEDPPAGWVAE